MNRLFLALGAGAATVALALPAGAQSGPDTRPKDRTGSLPFLWTNGEVGYQTANLRTFSSNDQTLGASVLPTVGSGPMVGAGAGLRLSFVTLGVRGRVGLLDGTTPAGTGQSFQLSSIVLELGVRIPLERFEPYFTLAGGYATLGGLSSAVNGLGSGLNVNGGDVRVGVGLDYFIEPWLSIGAHRTGELLARTRAAVPLRDLAQAKQIGSIDDAKARLLQANGTSVGSASTISGVLGFHFLRLAKQDRPAKTPRPPRGSCLPLASLASWRFFHFCS